VLRREGLIARVWPFALVGLVGLFVLLPRLGQFGLWDPWEPKYAQSAREMIERDSWVVPYYRGDVRLTKPILVYWGVRAGYAAFGEGEFGARIGGVALAIGTMLALQYAVGVLRGRRAGILAGLVLGTSPLAYLLARQATPDVYLYTSLGGAVLFLALGLFGPAARRTPHRIVAYACFALAVLAKGPVVAGVVAAGPFILCGALFIDWPRLVAPELRRATGRLAAALLCALPLLAACAVTAFLFGTSSEWWSYDQQGREIVGGWRTWIQVQSAARRLPELGLIAAAVGCGTVAWRLARSRAGRRRGHLAAAGLAGVAGLWALATLAGAGTAQRLLVASLVVGALALVAALAETWRLLAHPGLWPDVQPWVRPAAVQLGLFLLVQAVVAGPWHVAIVAQQGHGYFSDFLLKHNAERLAETVNNSGTSAYYLESLIFGMFPWSCLLPAALLLAVDWRQGDALRRQGFEVCLALSCLVTFAAFSCSATKFAHYLAPILVPATALVALLIERTLAEPRALASRLAWSAAALLFAPPLVDLLAEDGSENLLGALTVKRAVPEALAPGAYYHGLLLAVLALLALSAVVRSRWLVGALALAATLMAHDTATRFIPALSVHKSMKYLTDTWKARGADAPLCLYGEVKHGLYFYTNDRIERVTKPERFVQFMDPRRRAYCVIENKHVQVLDTALRRAHPGTALRLLDESHMNFSLASNEGAPDEPQAAPLVLDIDE